MIHEIKRSLGENATKEYINHINLLKMIKQEMDQNKNTFKERTQGVEFSLFIENVFVVEKPEQNVIEEYSSHNDAVSLVRNVLEKKQLIEKLQEKMNQRLDILNNLLANHAMNLPTPPAASMTPIIVKNNIKMINPNFGDQVSNQTFRMFENASVQQSSIDFKHFDIMKHIPKNHEKNTLFDWNKRSVENNKISSFNTANKKETKAGSVPFVWTANQSKKPRPVKAKKFFGETKVPFKSKKGAWYPSTNRKIVAKTITTEDMTPKPTLKKRRKSIDELKTSQLLSEPSVSDDECEQNVRLYLHKFLGFQHGELSPIRLEENIVTNVLKDKGRKRNSSKVQNPLNIIGVKMIKNKNYSG